MQPEGKCSNAGDISWGWEHSQDDLLSSSPLSMISINFSFPSFSSALRKSNLLHHGYRTLFHSYSSTGNLAQGWIPLKSQVRFLLKSCFFLMLSLWSGLSTAPLLPRNTQAFNFCQGNQLERMKPLDILSSLSPKCFWNYNQSEHWGKGLEQHECHRRLSKGSIS